MTRIRHIQTGNTGTVTVPGRYFHIVLQDGASHETHWDVRNCEPLDDAPLSDVPLPAAGYVEVSKEWLAACGFYQLLTDGVQVFRALRVWQGGGWDFAELDVPGRDPWVVNVSWRGRFLSLADFGDRITLAKIGVFSVDQPLHQAKREREAAEAAALDAAYEAVGQDRQHAYRGIAAKLEAGRTDGVWARSTKEYADACRQLDAEVLAFAEAAAEAPAVDLRVVDHGTLAIVELLTDEAKGWVRDNVEVPGWAWLGLGIAVDPRLVPSLIEGAEADGLTIA